MVYWLKHAYNELMLIVQWFSFSMGFKHIVRFMDITNYVYDYAKKPVLGIFEFYWIYCNVPGESA